MLATDEGVHEVNHCLEIERGFGVMREEPIMVGTDNLANAVVGSTYGTATRSKHFLRRYKAILDAVKRREVKVTHVKDVENPADFLTKFVSKAKLEMSIDYMTNRKAIDKKRARKVR